MTQAAPPSRGLPREGERGEEPLPAPRAAGNTASGPVSHYREADRTEVAEANLPDEPGLLGCLADPTVCRQPPQSPKLQSLESPAEPRTHPKPKSGALAGTDAPL